MTSLVLNSLGVALGACFLALPAGLLTALLALSAPRWVRFWLLLGAAATLALPPFLVANCWLELTAGWRARIGPENSALWMIPVAAGVLGGMYWPIPYFLILGRWQLIQRELIETEPGLRGMSLLQHWLLPVARPALVQSGLLVTSLAFSNFTVPTLFQIRVFTEEFWIRFNTGGDPWKALEQTWPMFVVPLILLPWLKPREFSWPRRNPTLPASLIRNRLGSGYPGLFVFSSLLLCAVLCLPIWKLASNPRSWTELAGAISANGPPIRTTLMTCLGAALVSSTLGLAIHGGRRHGFAQRFESVLWLPFLLPGIATGLLLIWICNRPFLDAIYQSPAILTLAFALRYSGPAFTALVLARRSLDPAWVDQARMDGMTWVQRFRHVYWPQMGTSLALSTYVGFLLCLWDVETAVLIQPPGGQTLALRIFNFLHYGHGTQVNALCILVLILAVLPLLAGTLLFFKRANLQNQGFDAT